MRIAWEGRELYCHISTKAGFDPVKTLYVCAPGADAASYEAAARFAQASGWREIAEQDGAVLVLPHRAARLAGGGRGAADGDLPRHARQLSDPKREKPVWARRLFVVLGNTDLCGGI